jgi:inner membrane transporter RhtA
VPAPALFVLSGVSGSSGSVIAVHLFERFAAPTVAWWRIVFAAIVLVALRRPWRIAWTRRDLIRAAIFGIVTAGMNITFYLAIDHLPIGMAVSIEFFGPVAVAAITGRGWRERSAIFVAFGGVLLLAGVSIESLPRADAIIGLSAVFAAAALWAGYIVLGKRVAGTGSGLDSLTLGMVVGLVVFAPFFAGTATTIVSDIAVLATLLALSLCATVIPYGLDQVVLRRIGTARFSILSALLPATAAVIGAVALAQVPSWAELAGLVLVSGAILMTSTRAKG